MHISKRLLLLWAVACIAIHAFGQNAIDGQTANDRESARQPSNACDVTHHAARLPNLLPAKPSTV